MPHTWLWASPLGAGIRAVELVDPVLTADVVLATKSHGPGSPIARALAASAGRLQLNDFFDAQLLGVTRRR